MLLMLVAMGGWVALAAITQLGDPGPGGQSDLFIYGMLGVVLTFGAIGIGSFVWFLIVSRRGMTPGKQLLGIRVVNLDGEPISRGKMIAREVLAKAPILLMFGGTSVIGGFLQFLPIMGAFLGLSRTGILHPLMLIALVVDNCWAFRGAGKQTMHDKIMGTTVVTNRSVVIQETPAESP